MKKQVRIIILAMFACVLFVVNSSKVSAFTVAEVKEKAHKVKPNKTISGSLETKDSEEFFKFTTEEKGYFEIEFGPTDNCDISQVGYGWDLSLYRVDDFSNPIRTYKGIKGKMTTAMYSFENDTFVVRIKSNYAYDDNTSPVGCEFYVRPKFTQDKYREFESNDEYIAANKIKTNHTYCGTLYHNKDVDWYTFQLEELGYFQVSMGPTERAELNNINSGWSISIYKEDNLSTPIYTYNDIKSEISSDVMAFEKGKYFVKIKADYDYSDDNAPTNCEYKMTVNTKKTSTWETERNNESTKADSIKTDSIYHGSLYYNGDVDWYKVKIKNDGTFKLELKPNNMISAGIGEGWKIELYDEDASVPIYTAKGIVKSYISPVFTYKKGTYYVKVSAYNDYGSNAPVGRIYDLKVSTSKSTSWEKEPNNIMNEATPIVANKLYQGITLKSNDVDWYVLPMKKDGSLTFAFQKSKKTDVSMVKDGWKVKIIRKRDNKVVAEYSSVTGKAGSTIKLGKGYYYVKVEAQSSWSSATECMYQFKCKVK